jgi:hypothetical protein
MIVDVIEWTRHIVTGNKSHNFTKKMPMVEKLFNMFNQVTITIKSERHHQQRQSSY